VTPIILKVIVK